MSTKTNTAANADLDTKYGAGTWYVAALTAITSGAAGTVTEVAGGTYARQAITFGAAAGRQKANSAQITLPQATIDHGNIVGWGIYNVLAAGSPAHVIPLATPIVYNTGYQPVINVGDLVVSEAAWADPNA